MRRIYAPRVTVKSGNRLFQISFEPGSERDFYDSAAQVRIREGAWEREHESEDTEFAYNHRHFKSMKTLIERIRKDFELTEVEGNAMCEAINYSLLAKANGGGKWKKFVVIKKEN